jgi:Chaperone of endosialidase
MAFWDYIPPVAVYKAATGQGGPLGPITDSLNRAQRAEELYGGVDPQGDMARAAGQMQQFGRQGARGYGDLGQEATRERGYLRGLARGQDSVSAEQLRQGLQQNISGQQAMAAGARPGMAPMAARTASMNAARMGSGLAGQQAIAGLQERQQAQQMLQQAILGQRQQDLAATQFGLGGAMQGYGGIENARTERYRALVGAPTPGEQIMQAGIGAAGLAAKASDRRLKKEIESGDQDADRLLKGLRAYRFKYTDEKHGKGRQLGIMAQDLERAGLRSAVIDTPEGKLVHGASLATALAAATARLARRLEKVEARG